MNAGIRQAITPPDESKGIAHERLKNWLVYRELRISGPALIARDSNSVA
jgi:hypothetical protein